MEDGPNHQVLDLSFAATNVYNRANIFFYDTPNAERGKSIANHAHFDVGLRPSNTLLLLEPNFTWLLARNTSLSQAA